MNWQMIIFYAALILFLSEKKYLFKLSWMTEKRMFILDGILVTLIIAYIIKMATQL